MVTGLGLLLHWMPPVTSTKITVHLHKDKPAADVIRMDMAENSVDDMYSGCLYAMKNKVVKELFNKELKDKTFRSGWTKAESCAKNKKNKKHEDKALTKKHFQAICLYTAGGEDNFYGIFNEAVRTGGKTYTTRFRYHSFHFWLTSALQILKDNQPGCYHTYRRTKLTLEGKINDRIRFGFFASSSLKDDLIQFGEETCFCIETCHGAYLKTYPRLGDHEKEVLIPPYEIFKITAKDSSECELDCKVTYTLKSAGTLSNQNCKVVGS